jgi:hypothetical protein
LVFLQCHLLALSMLHQHPAAWQRAANESGPVLQRVSQTIPAVAAELTCALCQIVRHGLALPVRCSPVGREATPASHPLLFLPADYHSQSVAVLSDRAPPLT